MPMPLLALLLLGSAQSESRLATDRSPAVIRPVVEARARCAANPQLVVALTQFTPPRRGPSTLVVSLRTADGRTSELGRAGIYPHQAFTASLAQARRFGFALPKGALERKPTVLVAIGSESGGGARATVGEARIAPAPGDRC
jgi:hypothetical protein